MFACEKFNINDKNLKIVPNPLLIRTNAYTESTNSKTCVGIILIL